MQIQIIHKTYRLTFKPDLTNMPRGYHRRIQTTSQSLPSLIYTHNINNKEVTKHAEPHPFSTPTAYFTAIAIDKRKLAVFAPARKIRYNSCETASAITVPLEIYVKLFELCRSHISADNCLPINKPTTAKPTRTETNIRVGKLQFIYYVCECNCAPR